MGDWVLKAFISSIRLSWVNGLERFVKEINPLWKRVIVGKYRMQEGEWCTKEVRGRYGVGVWKSIRNGWEVFKDKTRFQVGSGNRVKFRKNRWCGL